MPRRPPPPREVAAGYDRAALGYDGRHGDQVARARFERIERPLRAIARGAVLDLGCGTGRLLARLGAQAVGIDISREMLRAAPRELSVAVADAHRLPFADAAFDAVVAAKGTFRYLDYPRAMAECARVLRPGGRLAVHQYAARTWSPRARVTAADALHVDDVAELTGPAADAGLMVENTYLWRAVRVFPYALRIPSWPKNRLWNHCLLLFLRR